MDDTLTDLRNFELAKLKAEQKSELGQPSIFLTATDNDHDNNEADYAAGDNSDAGDSGDEDSGTKHGSSNNSNNNSSSNSRQERKVSPSLQSLSALALPPLRAPVQHSQPVQQRKPHSHSSLPMVGALPPLHAPHPHQPLLSMPSMSMPPLPLGLTSPLPPHTSLNSLSSPYAECDSEQDDDSSSGATRRSQRQRDKRIRSRQSALLQVGTSTRPGAGILKPLGISSGSGLNSGIGTGLLSLGMGSDGKSSSAGTAEHHQHHKSNNSNSQQQKPAAVPHRKSLRRSKTETSFWLFQRRRFAARLSSGSENGGRQVMVRFRMLATVPAGDIAGDNGNEEESSDVEDMLQLHDAVSDLLS